MSYYDVRSAASWVSSRAGSVQIDRKAIEHWADHVDPQTIRPATRPELLRFHGNLAEIAQWALLLDSLNFCFWSRTGTLWTIYYLGKHWQRYSALLAALHRAIARDPSWLRADRWTSATNTDLEQVFAGEGRIPLLEERVQILNQMGRALLDRYDGQALRLCEMAGFDAPRIAAEVCDQFEGFHDIHTYHGRPVPILKRAQILASDLHVAFKDNNGPPISHMEALTAFADYRVPQTQRHLKILVLDDRLEARIEAGEMIEASSEEEIELRACCIWAVELMAQALSRRRGINMPAWLVDEYLWEHSHDPEVKVRHHQTVTCFY